MKNSKVILSAICLMATAAGFTACSHSKEKAEPVVDPVVMSTPIATDTTATYSAAPANLGASSSGQGR